MRTTLALVLLIPLLTQTAWAEARFIPEIGPHEPLFIFEKNENPQNVLVSYVQFKGDGCRFVQDSKNKNIPYFDFYWMMNGEKYKPVHPLIKSGIRKRVEIQTQSADQRSFVLRLTDLSQLDKNLDSARVEVRSLRSDQGCRADAILTLNQKDQASMKLLSIFSEAGKTLLPPFRKVKSIEITGLTLKGNERTTLRF